MNNELQLSDDQRNAVDSLINWYGQSCPNQYITLGGYAGTGKTTTIGVFKEQIDKFNEQQDQSIDLNFDFEIESGKKLDITYLAPTGKAALQLRKRVKGDVVFIGTIHSYIYRPSLDKNGNLTGFVLDGTAIDNCPPDLIVVDEASMVQEELHNDLSSFNIPIIYVGDHGQLPPVKSDHFNLMTNPEIRLETIHRNAGGIAEVAEKVRKMEQLSYGKLKENVFKVRQSDNNKAVLDILYHPSPDRMVIVATNLYRTSLNKTVVKYLRNVLQNKTPDNVPIEGDRVICLRNNRKLGIFNGMVGTIEKIKDRSKDHYDMIFKPDCDEAIKVEKVSKHFFLNADGREPKGIFPKNIGERFDYAYAITCHKSQGSEADEVVVFGNGFGDSTFRARWMYTAYTRAIKQLYIVE